jgi:hypothetical protein
MKESVKKYLGVLCIFGLAFFIGYCAGFYSAINWGLTKAVNFLHSEGVNFTYSAQQLADILYKYKGIIDSATSH